MKKYHSSGNWRLSVSALNLFNMCPYAWYLRYIEHVKTQSNIYAFLGSCVHQFIGYWVDKETKAGRGIFFKSVESAGKAFWRYYYEEVSKNKFIRENYSEEAILNQAIYGKLCVQNYVSQNINNPRPMLIEKPYSVRNAFGLPLTLIGTIDQVRKIPIHKINDYNEGLVIEKNGVLTLNPLYAPIFLIDLKTNRSGYGHKDDASKEAKIKAQTELHLNLQATMYCYMIYMASDWHGHLPIAFGWYQVGVGKLWPTTRDLKSFDILESNLRNFCKIKRDAQDGFDYPRHPNKKNCAWCDFAAICSDGKKLVDPTAMFDGGITQISRPKILTPTYKQKRFKFPKEKF